ncbi:MAG: hypothetical protein ABFD64_09415 [Armatimonadota bacterium]
MNGIAPGASYEHLAKAIIARIKSVTTEVLLPNKEGEIVALKVIRSYFDPKSYEKYDLPAILVRVTAGSQNESEERTASVEIILGAFLKDYGDDEFLISIIERIEQDLLSQRILDHKYRLQMPLNWSVLDSTEQPWPYWFATMTASYYLPSIAEVRNEDGEGFDI